MSRDNVIVLSFSLLMLFIAFATGCGIKLEGMPRQFQLIPATPTPTAYPTGS